MCCQLPAGIHPLLISAKTLEVSLDKNLSKEGIISPCYLKTNFLFLLSGDSTWESDQTDSPRKKLSTEAVQVPQYGSLGQMAPGDSEDDLHNKNTPAA